MPAQVLGSAPGRRPAVPATDSVTHIARAQLAELLPSLTAVHQADAAATVGASLEALPGPIGLGVRLGTWPTRAALRVFAGGRFDIAAPQRQSRALHRAAALPVIGDYLRLTRTLAVVEALEALQSQEEGQ